MGNGWSAGWWWAATQNTWSCSEVEGLLIISNTESHARVIRVKERPANERLNKPTRKRGKERMKES